MRRETKQSDHPGLLRAGPGFGLAVAAARLRREREKKEREDYARTHGDYEVPRRKKK